RLSVQASAREGENVNLHVVLRSIAPSSGRLSILQNGEALDLDPDAAGLSKQVSLKEGLNVLQVPVAGLRSGPQKFEAVFEPDATGGRIAGDSILENNKALAVTFVTGQGKVLILSDNQQAAAPLVDALESSQIRTEVRSSAQAPSTLTELNAYDAILMMDQSAFAYSQQQQEELRQYIHDTGGGLIMIGGPNSFGAGGWIGSPLEDALPVNLDIPSKRQMPKGALALVIHSCEMPEGVFYGKKVCQAADESLSRADLAGIIEYSWSGATEWVHKLAPVGDGTALKRSINKLMFGDMPDFTPSLELAYKGLKDSEAGQKHVIMISDGDPQVPSDTLLQKFRDANISISTVGVFPHGGSDTSRMQYISKNTNGRHYVVNTEKELATVPQIFMKGAQTVRRSLLWEGAPFTPSLVPGLSDSLRGIGSVPPMTGYVVTAEREGLALVSMKGKEGDPIHAQWQYGLGKVVAFTSDAATRWNSSWVAWPGYRSFWEQNVRWVMRPGGSANVRVLTENRGDQTVVTVEALDSKGERLNFASFKGRLALPDGQGLDVDLKQVGPGRYQGAVATDRPGSYVLSLRYAAPDDAVQGGLIEGSVQAAVTRPFADEYRMLEDNTPLLMQVASLTGGRVLEWKPESENPWMRDGLKMPVSLQPIWQFIAVLGVGLFLVDVGVRRVRIDIPAIYRATLGLFGKGSVKTGQQLTGLRAARDAAKAKIASRGSGEGALSPTELEAQAKAAVKSAQEVSKAKFEASPELIRKTQQTTVIVGGADAKVSQQTTKPRPVDQPSQPQQQPGEGMSRLLKAKKKARDDMEE
ncbi:MAG: glutamine amidotransferase, partial [Planctomycetota bacterium]|nr:glutamine amidotransferase [Planctomycetota bacterium]